MNEQQLKEAFMLYLQLKSGALTQLEFEAYVQQLGEEGLQQEYMQFMQLLQLQQVASRKFGGMLNYIEKLRGICPEGYEMQFFKQGGQICKKCVQKAKMEDGGKTPENPIDAFRCGRRMKKKACGGTVKEAKCGTKIEMDKCGKKMKKKACGGNIKKAQKGTNLPTAPNASTVYKNGTLEYVGRPGFVYGDDNLIITAPNGRTILRRIVNWPFEPKPGEILGSDTIYEETPDHAFWVVPSPRKAQAGSTYDPRTGKTTYHKYGDADIMKRRWQEALSVSKDKRNK